MEKIIKNSFLIILGILIGFYSILIPLLIIFYDNGQILSLLENIHFITVFSVVMFILIILIYIVLIKSTKLIKLERNLLLSYIGLNLIFVFVILFLYISNFSDIIQDSLLLHIIIGIVYVIFSGLFIVILVSIKMKKNKNELNKNFNLS